MRTRNRRVSEEMEINLVPVLDIFVALIPFLLLTAAFVRLAGVSVNVPSFATAKSSVSSEKDERVQLTFQIEKGHILVSGFTEGFRKSVPEAKKLFTIQELGKLSAFIDDLHGKFLHLDQGIIHADASVPYQDVMRVLDVLEQSKALRGLSLAAGGGE